MRNDFFAPNAFTIICNINTFHKRPRMLKVESFFDLESFPDKELFNPDSEAWQPLNDLKSYMDSREYLPLDRSLIGDGIPLNCHIILHEGTFQKADDNCSITFGDATKGKLEIVRNGRQLAGASLLMAGSVFSGDRISLGQGVLVETGAMIKSPAIIGDYSEVRQGAYLRGYCLCGCRCVLGHTTEIKHSIFLNDAKAGHFAYIGDSILGCNANLGAGTKFANLRFLPGNVTILLDGERIDTGRKKFGAILGDGSQTGCNSVTSPGTLMGREAMLLPTTTAKGG